MSSGWLRACRAGLLGLAFLVVLLHAVGVVPLRFVTETELALADTRLRATLTGTRDPRIVIVDADERSLGEIGRWPWPRKRLAALVDELFERQQAAVVGFDMVFAEPDPAHDAAFARALQGRAVVLGFYLNDDPAAARIGVLPSPLFEPAVLQGWPVAFSRWNGYTANQPDLAAAAPAAGFFNSWPDADGAVRSVPLIATTQGRHVETLALAMLRHHTGGPAVRPQFPPQGWLPRSHAGLAGVALEQDGQRLVIPVDEHVAVRVPFRGAGGPRGGSFEYVSATDLLNGRVPPGQLAGKLVFVGSTAPGVFDLRTTPVSQAYPGVEVHASLLSGLLDGRTVVQPDWARGFEVVQLVAVMALLVLVLPRVGAATGIAATALLAAALVAVNLWLYRGPGLALPLASTLLLMALVFAVNTSWGYGVEGHRRRSLARLFGTYVPPELVRQMARDPARYTMEAQNRVLSVMFCDMRNFTRVSESLPPQELRALVNRFFSTMTQAIRAQRGTLDKYIGDAIMAFWGAPVEDPAHAEHAVRAALEMVERLAPLNAELQSRGLPTIGLGIGLNTGLVAVGDMGSDIRRSYTVMGDAVNLASRIEGLTRHYGVDILGGEATRQAAGDKLTWIEVDCVRVKGKQQAVTLFTPVPDPLARAPRFTEETRLWQLALACYRHQHWDQALAALSTLQEQFDMSAFGSLYRQLSERSAHFKNHPPPPGWDATFTFDSK
jgi:adenylate cyclase